MGQAKTVVRTQLEALAGITQDLATTEEQGVGAGQRYLWEDPPELYFEVLLWALAGILVRLIFKVGGYLRWRRFYRSGIYQHVTLLVVSPMLTLVFVLLISLIHVEGDVFSLNLGDPRILAGVSFLLAATPWKLWGRLMALADKALGEGQEESGGEAPKGGGVQ